jgi:hypothetical protein
LRRPKRSTIEGSSAPEEDEEEEEEKEEEENEEEEEECRSYCYDKPRTPSSNKPLI